MAAERFVGSPWRLEAIRLWGHHRIKGLAFHEMNPVLPNSEEDSAIFSINFQTQSAETPGPQLSLVFTEKKTTPTHPMCLFS